jgi:hypothetical protein
VFPNLAANSAVRPQARFWLPTSIEAPPGMPVAAGLWKLPTFVVALGPYRKPYFPEAKFTCNFNAELHLKRHT